MDINDGLSVIARLGVHWGPRPRSRPTSTRYAACLPDRATALRRLRGELTGPEEALPAVLRHDDLWAGNLLVEDGRLTGVVDWDAWHPRGMPGADLVQFAGTDHRMRAHLALGPGWLAGLARDTRAGLLARGRRRDTTEALELAALAWWTAEVAGTLGRLCHRANDERWLATNVDAVPSALEV